MQIRYPALAAAAAVLLLAGCASGSTAAEPAPAASAGTDSAFPVTVENCATTVTVEAAPERIVTIKSTTTELLLALGLGERIVGSAFLDGPLPASLEEAGADLNVISDFVPGQEAVLALTPDFVYGGWESNFSAEGVGERAALADLGIGSYVSPAACKGDAMPDPLTFDTVFAEISEAGALFGVPDAAAALVTDQEAELAALKPAAGDTTALWYSSGTDTPYVGAGIGAPQMILDAAGLTNIFADVQDTWTSAGWESVVAANPDVLVLVDADWNTADSKIANLKANPATAGLAAVLNDRYIVVPFAAGEAGIRNVEAAASIIDQLAELQTE
ncbi:putative F420-0 ABC transporter substrate-binding protein [Cryobacterium sp.]|jgi:iron complex transport system substrate-binding protein|uniref:putative F420-0 ABC transporter substrate-binding protein n=1 Tax=Cryobacterium sp. TaxID=1926290 RepID=UPI002625FA16|nr:putative F420-0 ABC transporter substrate-binding protein [Cryobacterium sp.]MCU1444454.1 putative transporter substrate-binding protein [Cryobacterium sp.]